LKKTLPWPKNENHCYGFPIGPLFCWCIDNLGINSRIVFGIWTLVFEVWKFRRKVSLEIDFALFIKKDISSISKLFMVKGFLLFYFYSTKNHYNYSINDSSIWNTILWAEEQNAIKITMVTSIQSLLEVGFPFLIIHSLVLSYCEIMMKLIHFGFESG
jgi:hypothetical protein